MYYIPGQKEARRGAGAEMCNYKRDQSWVRSPFEEIKFLFKFFFLGSSVEAKSGVDFHNQFNQSTMPPEFEAK